MSVATSRDYFIGILMYKTINGIGIDYFEKHMLMNITITILEQPVIIVQNKPHCELYRSSLYYEGIQLWNSLPNSIKSIHNLSQF